MENSTTERLAQVLRIAIVHARWNKPVIDAFLQGVLPKLKAVGVKENNIVVQNVCRSKCTKDSFARGAIPSHETCQSPRVARTSVSHLARFALRVARISHPLHEDPGTS